MAGPTELRSRAPTGSTGSAASPWAQLARKCASRVRWKICRRCPRRWLREVELFQGTRDHSGRHTETEDNLLMIAEHGTAQHVEKLVRAFRRCKDAEELTREARQQQTRSITYRHDDDGSLILVCRLPAEAGALIVRALELALEKLPAIVNFRATFRLERPDSRSLSVRAAPMPSPSLRRALSRTMCWRPPAPTAIKSSCMLPRRPCGSAPRAAVSSSTGLRWRRKPRAGSRAMRASSR